MAKDAVYCSHRKLAVSKSEHCPDQSCDNCNLFPVKKSQQAPKPESNIQQWAEKVLSKEDNQAFILGFKEITELHKRAAADHGITLDQFMSIVLDLHHISADYDLQRILGSLLRWTGLYCKNPECGKPLLVKRFTELTYQEIYGRLSRTKSVPVETAICERICYKKNALQIQECQEKRYRTFYAVYGKDAASPQIKKWQQKGDCPVFSQQSVACEDVKGNDRCIILTDIRCRDIAYRPNKVIDTETRRQGNQAQVRCRDIKANPMGGIESLLQERIDCLLSFSRRRTANLNRSPYCSKDCKARHQDRKANRKR